MFRPFLRSCARHAVPLRPALPSRSFATFNWEDPLASKNLLTEEESAIRETAERYCQEQLAPRVLRIFSRLLAV